MLMIPSKTLQKCRIRLRDARIGVYDQLRDSGAHQTAADRRQLIGSLVADELRDLDVDLALQEQIAAELSEEAYAWHLDAISQREELAAIEAAPPDGLAGPAPPPFFCPICETDVLQPVFDHFACERCALRFKSSAAGGQLQAALLRTLAEHERRPPDGCAAAVTFFAEPVPASQFASLNLVCAACDFYATFRP